MVSYAALMAPPVACVMVSVASGTRSLFVVGASQSSWSSTHQLQDDREAKTKYLYAIATMRLLRCAFNGRLSFVEPNICSVLRWRRNCCKTVQTGPEAVTPTSIGNTAGRSARGVDNPVLTPSRASQHRTWKAQLTGRVDHAGQPNRVLRFRPRGK